MAAHTRLATNATLRSVVPTLDNKMEFVSRAYAKMNALNRSHGPVVLRLGVSAGSKGKRPNYLIQCAEKESDVATIDGNTHEPWIGAAAAPDGAWSEVAMTFAEVRELLAELRLEERPGGRTR